MHTKEFLFEIYRKLYTIRIFETECVKLYRQGLIRGYFHPYTGEEAIATGVCAALGDGDFITSTHRGHGHCIARGASIDKMVAELLGKRTGYCQGLGGSMHIADVATGNLGANGVVGAGLPIGVGAALSLKMKKSKNVVAMFFSDGAANNGVFTESLNLAAIWNLPAIFILENNHFAVSTPIEESSRTPDLYKRGKGYGVTSSSVDGNDVLKVYEKTVEAVELCQKAKGPILIEAKTYRHGGHHVNDPGQYMPEDRLKYYKSKDPLTICKKYLNKLAKISTEEIKLLETELENEMAQAITFAKESDELSMDEFYKFVEEY
jgi:pyruvate dehydrogenase E1 component alpha subunit